MVDTSIPARARLREQLTTRLPLLWISLSFLAGIPLARVINLPIWVWLALACLVAVLTILLPRFSQRLRHSPNFLPRITHSFIPFTFYFLLITSFLLGAARYQSAIPAITPAQISFYNDRDYDLLVTGIIADFPDSRDTYTNLRLRVEAVDTGRGDLRVKGLLLGRVSAQQTYQYGERVRLRGRLETPPEDEDFSYRDYLARQNIHSYMSFAEVSVLPGTGGNPILAAVYQLKARSLENVYRLFPDPEASLLAGILLGVDSGLSRPLQEAFRDTGTAHIIAISGFNIAIIAGVFVTLFSRWFGRWRGALAAVLGIAFYTILVGANAAVVRAAFMGSLALLARQIGRRTLALNTLAFTACLMALINPLVLWDVGFQLSSLATLGLILYAVPFSQTAQRLLFQAGVKPSTIESIIRPFTDFILLTLAAQLTTIPIIAWHFNRISLISFIANPFILPAQPAVMILGGLAVFLSLILYPLGQFAALIAWPFVSYTIRMVELFDRLPHGAIHLGNFSFWFMLIFYTILLGMTFSWTRIRDWFSSLGTRVRSLSLVTILIALFICSTLTWRAALNAGDGQLHLTFLDVGSADSILIQTPAGRNVLINGGPSASQLSDQLGRRLPFVRRELDWLVISSTAENEVAALPRVLERYPPEQVLWSGNVQASFSSRQVDIWLADHEIPLIPAEPGQRLDLGDGAFIEVVVEGARGSVLVVEWNNFRAVLPIGVEADTMAALEYGNVIGSTDVLLLADSGYAQSNPPDWIENLNPQLIVLSVAAGDPDGLPEQETLEALEGYSFLRTDRNGWISVATDGTQMRVETEKEGAPLEGDITLEEGAPPMPRLPNKPGD